jgi:hypothetical protein
MEVYALIRLQTPGDRDATTGRLRRAGVGEVLTAVPRLDSTESAFGVGESDFDLVIAVRDVAGAADALASEPIDPDVSCAVAGTCTLVFDDVVALRFFCLLERADGMARAEFERSWQDDFVKIVHATPGQISYSQLVVDPGETARVAKALGISAAISDGLAIGGFADRIGLESAIRWANVDESHRRATTNLLAPRYRKILTEANT